jgi:hypothetical protein
MPVKQDLRIKLLNLKHKIDEYKRLAQSKVHIPEEFFDKTPFFHQNEILINLIGSLLEDIARVLELMDKEYHGRPAGGQDDRRGVH